jgi:hypothetical protein
MPGRPVLAARGVPHGRTLDHGNELRWCVHKANHISPAEGTKRDIILYPTVSAYRSSRGGLHLVTGPRHDSCTQAGSHSAAPHIKVSTTYSTQYMRNMTHAAQAASPHQSIDHGTVRSIMRT